MRKRENKEMKNKKDKTNFPLCLIMVPLSLDFILLLGLLPIIFIQHTYSRLILKSKNIQNQRISAI